MSVLGIITSALAVVSLLVFAVIGYMIAHRLGRIVYVLHKIAAALQGTRSQEADSSRRP
jgi:TRAP-type C4-dicarboxylate transport system permease small subunit